MEIGRGPQPLVYINHSLTTHVTSYVLLLLSSRLVSTGFKKSEDIIESIKTYATHTSVEHVMRPRYVACRRCYCRGRKGETKLD